ncbi:Putative uncharacterized protein [Moritella viscosa]|uniref:Uncharacterized protein n=1 Tax=Moritella viscosa TaxID=80854 RepID=A0A1K9ZQE7_9GAMM|nr:Putative uncharacterized protein [Moritella viscosa]SHO06358.1 Putative uncharacterized protein [Moritella viscosa]SHO06370.1 Putative uncharacterized protein [Moritella viscosa]SHO09903.1 Putative uncharacterized protein [Moritella viscosa]
MCEAINLYLFVFVGFKLRWFFSTAKLALQFTLQKLIMMMS